MQNRRYEEFQGDGYKRRVYYDRDGWLVEVWEYESGGAVLGISTPVDELGDALLWAVSDLVSVILGEPTAIFSDCDAAEAGTSEQQA